MTTIANEDDLWAQALEDQVENEMKVKEDALMTLEGITQFQCIESLPYFYLSWLLSLLYYNTQCHNLLSSNCINHLIFLEVYEFIMYCLILKRIQVYF